MVNIELYNARCDWRCVNWEGVGRLRSKKEWLKPWSLECSRTIWNLGIKCTEIRCCRFYLFPVPLCKCQTSNAQEKKNVNVGNLHLAYHWHTIACPFNVDRDTVYLVTTIAFRWGSSKMSPGHAAREHKGEVSEGDGHPKGFMRFPCVSYVIIISLIFQDVEVRCFLATAV